MIGKYLYELLKINSRVIIPDFGAFLVKEKPGGKMEITYNDFLKFNDGLLVNKIIKTEGVNKTEATKKIKEYVDTMEDTFRKGERFKIESVGEFFKDDFNRIKFESFVEEKAETKEEKKPEKKVIKEEKPAEKPKEEAKKEEKKEEAKPVEKPKEEEAKKDVKLSEKITDKVATSKPELKEEKKMEQKPTVSKTASTTKSETVVKKSGSNTIIWVGAIVVVVAALITWGVLDYDRISSWFGGHEEETITAPVEIAPVDSIQEDTTAVLDTNEEIMVEEEAAEEVEPEPVYEGPKYYVVAGSFKVENNAINYHQKLVEDGYNSKNLGLINGFYTVSFDEFKSLKDAVKMMKMVKADQEDVWVLKH